MENSCWEKYKLSSKKWILASRRTGFRRNSALIPANAGLFHYAGNNPVRYIDPDGRLQRNAQNQLQAKQFAQIKTKSTIYDVFLLKTDKKRTVFGFRDVKNPDVIDISGQALADSKFSLNPADVTYSDFKKLSEWSGESISKDSNLERVLEDDCSKVSKKDVKKEDLLVINSSAFNKKFKDILGIILSKKNGLISDTYTLKKGPGNIKEYNEKEISNEIEIYRKNNSN